MGKNKTLDVGTLKAELRDVLLPMGLNLSLVKISGEQIHLEQEPFEFRLSQPGELEVTVTQEDLQKFLTLKAPGSVKDFSIKLEDGLIFVEATARMIVEIRAKATCTLRIEEGKRVFVDLKNVDVLGVGAKGIVQNQLDQINPVLDVADLPVSAEIRTVRIENGVAVITGAIAPR